MNSCLVNLSHIQNFCNNKSIAIIGNSDKIIGTGYGKQIDGHDIVVRMNHAPKYIKGHSNDIGTKLDLYVAGISRIEIVKAVLGNFKPEVTLFLAPWTPVDRVILSNISNSYISTKEEYAKIKEKFGTYKPSSGSLVISFLVNNVNYSKISLYGFDFFSSCDNNRRNTFNSFLYKDHSSALEREYITSILNDKIQIYQ